MGGTDGKFCTFEEPGFTFTPDLGVGYVTDDSAKFGEYTGLNKSGAYGIGNFDVRGGDAYTEDKGTKRWQVWGTDIGLTSRAVGGSVSDQGRWTLGFTVDQLTHYTSDSYQTPYAGNMGGNSFTLLETKTFDSGAVALHYRPLTA